MGNEKLLQSAGPCCRHGCRPKIAIRARRKAVKNTFAIRWGDEIQLNRRQ